jgi:hypothetical protein
MIINHVVGRQQMMLSVIQNAWAMVADAETRE